MDVSVNQPLSITVYYPKAWGKSKVLQDIDRNTSHLVNVEILRDEDRRYRVEAKMPFKRKIKNKTKNALLAMISMGMISGIDKNW